LYIIVLYCPYGTFSSAPNLVAGLRNDFDRLACAAHDLNLVVSHGVHDAEEPVKQALHAAKELVRHFKQSGLNCDSRLFTRLVQQCDTRWNTAYLMLSSIVENWKPVKEILDDRDELEYVTALRKPLLESIIRPLKMLYKVISNKQNIFRQASYLDMYYFCVRLLPCFKRKTRLHCLWSLLCISV